MKVRKAVAGMEVSTEWVVLMFETRWTNGAKMSGGSFRTKAAILYIHVSYSTIGHSSEDLPFDGLVLHFAILIIQGHEYAINNFGA